MEQETHAFSAVVNYNSDDTISCIELKSGQRISGLPQTEVFVAAEDADSLTFESDVFKIAIPFYKFAYNYYFTGTKITDYNTNWYIDGSDTGSNKLFRSDYTGYDDAQFKSFALDLMEQESTPKAFIVNYNDDGTINFLVAKNDVTNVISDTNKDLYVTHAHFDSVATKEAHLSLTPTKFHKVAY